MNEKRCKRIRRAIREYLSVAKLPREWEYNRDQRTGVVRLPPNSPRALYQKTKRIMLDVRAKVA